MGLLKFKQIKILFLISILTLFLSMVIFLFKFFNFDYEETLNHQIEEKYIENTDLNSPNEDVSNFTLEKKDTKEKPKKIKFSYIPNSFKHNLEIGNYKTYFQNFLDYETIDEKIEFLEVYLYKQKQGVRGRMKNKKIHIFDSFSMTRSEFLAVCIHEFAHFLDLYILEKQVFEDLSEYFYTISWQSTKVLKSSQTKTDFVSGYAMTNKYEDFAESFTYYVFHNKDFLEKSKKSNYLKRKYDFFSNYIFKNGDFKDFDDNKIEKVKDYYWDTTKIDFDFQGFLKYLDR